MIQQRHQHQRTGDASGADTVGEQHCVSSSDISSTHLRTPAAASVAASSCSSVSGCEGAEDGVGISSLILHGLWRYTRKSQNSQLQCGGTRKGGGGRGRGEAKCTVLGRTPPKPSCHPPGSSAARGSGRCLSRSWTPWPERCERSQGKPCPAPSPSPSHRCPLTPRLR